MVGNLKRMKLVLGEKVTEYLLALLLLSKKGDNCEIDKAPKDSMEYYFQMKYLAVLTSYKIVELYDRKTKILCYINRSKIEVL